MVGELVGVMHMVYLSVSWKVCVVALFERAPRVVYCKVGVCSCRAGRGVRMPFHHCNVQAVW